jgi:Zn-dependent peptidase ImmA (M78 family)
MEKITAVNHNILKWARESSHMDISHVSTKFSKISDWENGTDHPTYAQLEQLVDMYKKPVAVFFFPNIPNISTLKSSCRTLPEYTFESLSYKMIRKMNKGKVMQINLRELHEDVNPAPVQLTKLSFSKDIKNAAKELRGLLGITLAEQKQIRKIDTALELWRESLLRHGIYVFKDAFEDDSVSGFCLYDEEFPIIYINNSMTFTRQLFTLFHEVFHLISHTSGIDKIHDDFFESLTKDQLIIEQACNAFAGEFLVPDSDLQQEIKNKEIDDEFVKYLASRYCVSREVIMRKMLNMKLISQREYEEKRAEYTADAIRALQNKKVEKSGGNPYNTKISYLGSGYLHLVFNKYAKNMIDIYQLSNYTSTKLEHLPKLERAWGGRFGR